jgi:TATA-binding protein-associated factor
MDTDQLLDLFAYGRSQPGAAGSEESSGGVDELGKVDGKKKSGLRAVLDDLETLWDEAQYEEEFDIDAYLKRLPPS